MSVILDESTAYAAMFEFLNSYYESTKSDDIGSLLGSMSIMEDGDPVDIAFKYEWKESIEKAIKGKTDGSFFVKKTISSSALRKSGQVLDRGGFTRAGRALQKHGDRPSSVFPRATGNVTAKNAQGQAALDDILSNVSRTQPNNLGEVGYYEGVRGGGARFDSQDNFIGFLEP